MCYRSSMLLCCLVLAGAGLWSLTHLSEGQFSSREPSQPQLQSATETTTYARRRFRGTGRRVIMAIGPSSTTDNKSSVPAS